MSDDDEIPDEPAGDGTTADGTTVDGTAADTDAEADSEVNNEADDEPIDSDGDAFADEIERARDLLDGDDVEALHVGVVRGGEVDTTFAQRGTGGAEEEGLRALALLAAHVRLVANEAGVDPSTVAGDAATLAGRVERIPARTEDLPDE